MNYKMTYQERANKEKIGLLEKEQQLEELKERLQTVRPECAFIIQSIAES